MCKNFIPGPAYKVGDRIQTRWVTDDTKELDVQTGVIHATTFTTNKHHPALDMGWNYHVYFDDGTDNEVHESEVILIGEVSGVE